MAQNSLHNSILPAKEISEWIEQIERLPIDIREKQLSRLVRINGQIGTDPHEFYANLVA